jgi:hypothetical protein
MFIRHLGDEQQSDLRPQIRYVVFSIDVMIINSSTNAAAGTIDS